MNSGRNLLPAPAAAVLFLLSVSSHVTGATFRSRPSLSLTRLATREPARGVHNDGLAYIAVIYDSLSRTFQHYLFSPATLFSQIATNDYTSGGH